MSSDLFNNFARTRGIFSQDSHPLVRHFFLRLAKQFQIETHSRFRLLKYKYQSAAKIRLEQSAVEQDA